MSHGETVRFSAGRACRSASTTELHHLSFVPPRLHSSPTECTQYQLMRCRLTKDSLAGFSAKRTASAGRSLTSTTGRLSRWYRGCFLQPDRLSIANAAAPHSYAAVTKRFPDISAVDISLGRVLHARPLLKLSYPPKTWFDGHIQNAPLHAPIKEPQITKVAPASRMSPSPSSNE